MNKKEQPRWLVQRQQTITRNKETYEHLYKEGRRVKTYTEVAALMNVSPTTIRLRATEHLKRIARKPHWTDGMSSRLRSFVFDRNITTLEQLREAAEKKTFGKCDLLRYQHYGLTTHAELLEIVGLPPLLARTICPLCGSTRASKANETAC